MAYRYRVRVHYADGTVEEFDVPKEAIDAEVVYEEEDAD